MVEYMPFDPKWFKDLKENRKDFYDVNNMIESAKYKYDRELKLPQWVIGTGITIFLASGVKFSNFNPIILPYVIGGFIISAIMLFIGLILITKLAKIQQISMVYLYREKDKQDRDRKTKPNK